MSPYWRMKSRTAGPRETWYNHTMLFKTMMHMVTYGTDPEGVLSLKGITLRPPLYPKPNLGSVAASHKADRAQQFIGGASVPF